jgi:hypothetical protein
VLVQSFLKRSDCLIEVVQLSLKVSRVVGAHLALVISSASRANCAEPIAQAYVIKLLTTRLILTLGRKTSLLEAFAVPEAC